VPRTGDGHDIPRALKAEIERERLRLVMDMIRKVEAERDAAHDNAGQVGRLTRHRRDLRARPRQRGVLPRLRQPA
jgi:hypothetical protein